MQFSKNLPKEKSLYLIPILLLIGSYSIYAYNLEGQPWHGDEVIYFGYAGIYFNLIKDGDFENPCIINIGKNCDLIFANHPKVAEANYIIVKNFFIGLSQYLSTGTNEGEFYNWSAYWTSEFEPEKAAPSVSEFATVRILSPIFGSFTVLFAYFIGKIIFNRNVGLVFSIILLFYGQWMLNGRSIMAEVYTMFFLMLSITLLLYSLNMKRNGRIAYFVFSAISFGLAINSKLTAIELSFLFLGIILFGNKLNEKINLNYFKNKREVLRIILLLFVGSTIVASSFLFFTPRYHENPLDVFDSPKKYQAYPFLTVPSLEHDHLFRFLATIHSTLIPYFVDYYDSPLNEFYKGKPPLYLSWDGPQTYSSLPLSIFFFIGLGYIINKIRKKELKYSELLVLIWFVSLLILAVLLNRDYRIERLILYLMFPIMLIATYGLWSFVRNISNKKLQYSFTGYFILTHALVALVSWDILYYSYGKQWSNPLTHFTIQSSITDPIVVGSSIGFMVFLLFIIGYKIKIKNV